MNKWTNIYINLNLLKHDTGKSTLIAMPHKSAYNNYKFWHPSKLIRDVRNRTDIVSLGYSDDFTFRLKKYNYDKVTDEIELNVADFEKAFSVIHGNIESSITNEPEEPVTHIPEHKAPVEPVVDSELQDD